MVFSILLHVTLVDDSIRGLQGPCVYFWGVEQDSNFQMENYIASIQSELQSRSPPSNVNELDNRTICCVQINKKWQRARVPELKLSPLGALQVFCIDNGETHSVPLSFVRTVDITGIEADHIQQTPPLAKKYILADVVGPRGPGSGSQWSIPAISFLKTRLENKTWKAVSLDSSDAEHSTLRLFDLSNHLFAATMVEEGFGVLSQMYQDTLSIGQVLNDASARLVPCALDRDHHSLFDVLATNSDVSSYSSPKNSPDLASVSRENVLQTISPVKDFSSSASLANSLDPILQINPKIITEISNVDLAVEENLFVIYSEKSGFFFGKLEKLSVKDLDEMSAELQVYSTIQNPPILYQDKKSHLGQYGALEWTEGQNRQFRRILILDELQDEIVKVHLIDNGNYLWIPRRKILAALDCFAHFCQPPHGIRCKLDRNIPLDSLQWCELLLEKCVTVKVGACVDGIHSVSFVDDSLTKKLEATLHSKSSPGDSADSADGEWIDLDVTQADKAELYSILEGNRGDTNCARVSTSDSTVAESEGENVDKNEARKRKRRQKKKTHNTEREARLKRAKKTETEALRRTGREDQGKENWKLVNNNEQETASLTKLNFAVNKIFFGLIEDVLTELVEEEIDDQKLQNEIPDHFSDVSLDYED